MIETMTASHDALTVLAVTEPTLIDEDTWIGRLQAWALDLPESVQWLGIILISAIPFLESYGGGFVGVIAGMPLVAAVAAATLGNMISLVLVVYVAHWIRSAAMKKRNGQAVDEEKSTRRDKVKRLFDKFGVPGVSLLGPFALPSQITAPLMVSFGASKNAVMLWMLLSVILWGLGFALLGIAFLNIFG